MTYRKHSQINHKDHDHRRASRGLPGRSLQPSAFARKGVDLIITYHSESHRSRPPASSEIQALGRKAVALRADDQAT